MIQKGKTLKDAAAGPLANFRLQVNDGSTQPPRLLTGFSDSAMAGLMDNVPLKIRLRRVAEAGYSFYQGRWADADQASDAGQLVAEAGLGLVFQAQLPDADRIDAELDLARRADPIAVIATVGDPWIDEVRTVQLVEQITHKFEAAHLPVMIHTRRGCATQDLLRTLRWADRCTCRFALDFSHWALAGEPAGGPGDDWIAQLRPILGRVGMIVGRISNGQQIQLPPRSAGEPTVIAYQKLWATAMGLWKRTATAGDVFLFDPGLEPPDYALRDKAGLEQVDRWDESRELVELARNAWNAVQ